MKAVQIQAPGQVAVVDVPVPEIAENEVLVKVVCCVTCPHWDITLFKGVDIFDRPGYPHYPIPWGYPGHEMSGDVVAVGAGVRGLKVGDRVGALCNAGEFSPGYYAEFINRPEDELAKLPDNVSYEAGANLEMCRYIAPFMRKLPDLTGKRTGVTGVGPAGLIVLQMLKAMGAADVVAIDVVPERLALAMQLGATDTVNSATEEIAKIKDNPLFATVDCSGIAAGLQTAFDHTSDYVYTFGVPHGDVIYSTRHWSLNIITGANMPTAEDTNAVLDLWRKGQLNTDALVTVKLPFARYTEGIEMLMARKAIKVGFYPG